MAIGLRDLVLPVIIVVAALGSFLLHHSVRHKARLTVRERTPLSDQEFAALFGLPAEAAIAPLIRGLLKRYIPVDPALVWPSDKLCADLQLAAIDGLEANAFVEDVERQLGVNIPDDVASKMLTLRDVVSYVASHRQAMV
jgi:hypothetical protein